MYTGHTSQPFSKRYVDQFGSERIVLIYDCCYAELMGKNMRKEGRDTHVIERTRGELW